MTAGDVAAGLAEEVSTPAVGIRERPGCGARGIRGGLGLRLPRRPESENSGEALEPPLGSPGCSAFPASALRLPACGRGGLDAAGAAAATAS